MNWTTYNNAGAALSQSLTDMPVGTITGYAGTTAPSGWLLCDGSAVSRTTYAELFGVVSTTYGSGDGSTTFNVPDSSGFIILASSQAARLAAAALPQYVTSLPSSPVDGQTVVYAADASNGVMWTLRYRAASSSSYKWEFVGGPPLWSQADGTERTKTVAASTWSDIHTSDPSVTVPLAGDYAIQHRARLSVNSGAATFYLGIKVGSTEASTTDVLSTSFYESLATAGVTPNVTGVKTGIAASTAITQRYWQNAGTVTFARMQANLTVTPVRVG